MRKIFLVLAVLMLSGCAQWQELSDGEKTGIMVGAAVLIGANLISNTQDNTVNNCISTRSLETGCGKFKP